MTVGIVIEIDTPVPDVQEIKSSVYNQIKDQILDLPFPQQMDFLSLIKIPEIPVLPIPVFINYSSIPEQINMFLSSVKLFQDFTTIWTYLLSFSTVLATPTTLLVSKIPNMDFFITDVMLGDMEKLYEQIDIILSDETKELPYDIPKNQYFCFSSPMDRTVIGSRILEEYKNDLLNQSSNLLEKVADYLQVQLPSLPIVPDINVEQLYKHVFDLIPKSPFEVIMEYSLEDILNILPIPLPPKISTDNLTLFSSNTEKDFKDLLVAIVDYYKNIYFNAIVDIINNTFKSLNIQFPLLRYTI